MYLLDTDHIVLLQHNGGAARNLILERMSAHPVEHFFVSVVSFHEQFAGWQAALSRKSPPEVVCRAYLEFERLIDAYASVQVASFGLPEAARFEALRSQKVRIGTMDLRIASIALVRGWTVLTRNAVDFEQVPSLAHEDWALPPRTSLPR